VRKPKQQKRKPTLLVRKRLWKPKKHRKLPSKLSGFARKPNKSATQ
jgi:hypothetical protein